MAASQSEADKLRQQIAFLTNLINTARNPGPNHAAPVPHLRHPQMSPRSLGFGGVQSNPFRHQQPRFPPNQTYLHVNNRQPTPSRVSLEASNVRFPLSNSATNHANMAAGAALFNRHTNPNTAGTMFKPGIPSQSNRTVYMPNTHPSSSSVGNNFAGSNNQANVSKVLGTAIIRQQNPAQILQGPSLQQRVSQNSRIGANFVQRSLHNADVCVQTTRPAHTVTSTVNNTNPMLSLQNRHPTSVPQAASGTSQGLLGPGLVQTSAGMSTQSAPAASSSQSEEPKMQQMAILMEELQKTQSKILDLQKQLVVSSHNPQPQQSPQPQQQQTAVMQAPSPVPSGAGVPGLMGVGLGGGHQPGIPGMLNVTAAHGQPLAQSNKVWMRNSAGQAPQIVGNMSNQQVVGRPVCASRVWTAHPSQPNRPQLLSPRHPTSLTGPRLVKPIHAQHPAPVVLNTRFQLKRLQSQAIANCIQSVRAAQARNIQQSVSAVQFQNIQQSVRAAHFRNIQQSVRAAQVRSIQQSVRAAHVHSMQQSVSMAHGTGIQQSFTSVQVNNNTHTGQTVTRIQSVNAASTSGLQSTRGSQMIVSKYKLQRAGLVRSHVAAQAIVSKYKLQKATVYGYRGTQLNQIRGKFSIKHSRSHQHYPYSSRFPSMFYPPTRAHQNMWRSVRGRRGVSRAWKTYQHQAFPWTTRPIYRGRHTQYRGEQFPAYGTTSQVWKKRQWLSWKQRSQLAVKRLLRKRLQLLHKAIPPHKSKLKLDRRYQTVKSSPDDRAATRTTSTRLVLINGLLYKSSSKSLTKATVSSPSCKGPSTSGVKATTSRKTSVVVRKLNSSAMKTIKVRGVKFRMDTSGRSLQRIDQSPSPSKSKSGYHPKTEVKRVDIGGVTFIQTKPGTLVRSATTRTRAFASRMKTRSIAAATQSLRKDNTKSVNGYCVFFNKFGRCKLGIHCPYKHDPTKVAVCTRFLRGTCKVDNCPFSHKVSREKMPVCLFFLRGTCNRDDCPYLHVKVNRDAAICEDFVRGFCPRGEQCQKKHTLRCPTFEKSGTCPRGKNCPMRHKRSARRPPRSSRLGSGSKRSSEPSGRTESGQSASYDLDLSAVDGEVTSSEIGTGGTVMNMEKKKSDSTEAISSQTEFGVSKVADPMSSHQVESCEDVPECVPDKQENTVSDSSQSVPEEEGAPAPVTSATASIPDKLPSYISLLEVSSHTEEKHTDTEQSNTEGTTLHIRPRL